MCQARDRLRESGESSPTIEQLVCEVRISPFHFIRQFEAVFGVTPHQYRGITVVGEGRDDLELALEPNANPAGRTFQEAMFAQGIPLAAFEVSDLRGEFARLTGHGVAFTREPRSAGPVTLAVFSDTCGNLIQLYQPN